MENKTKYSYPTFMRYGSYLLSFYLVFDFGRRMILLSYKSIQLAITTQSAKPVISILIPILILLPIITTVILFWQEFTITPKGIEFQVFIFWRKFVPWEKVIRIKKSFMPWAKYHIIITEELTFFHRVLGLLYGFTIYPGFVVNKTIIGYDKAILTIQKQLNSKTNETQTSG